MVAQQNNIRTALHCPQLHCHATYLIDATQPQERNLAPQTAGPSATGREAHTPACPGTQGAIWPLQLRWATSKVNPHPCLCACVLQLHQDSRNKHVYYNWHKKHKLVCMHTQRTLFWQFTGTHAVNTQGMLIRRTVIHAHYGARPDQRPHHSVLLQVQRPFFSRRTQQSPSYTSRVLPYVWSWHHTHTAQASPRSQRGQCSSADPQFSPTSPCSDISISKHRDHTNPSPRSLWVPSPRCPKKPCIP
jgi:hypothetical protein